MQAATISASNYEEHAKFQTQNALEWFRVTEEFCLSFSKYSLS